MYKRQENAVSIFWTVQDGLHTFPQFWTFVLSLRFCISDKNLLFAKDGNLPVQKHPIPVMAPLWWNLSTPKDTCRNRQRVRQILLVRCVCQNRAPVSYTHLDVYKRQEHVIGNIIVGPEFEVCINLCVDLFCNPSDSVIVLFVDILFANFYPVSYTHLIWFVGSGRREHSVRYRPHHRRKPGAGILRFEKTEFQPGNGIANHY